MRNSKIDLLMKKRMMFLLLLLTFTFFILIARVTYIQFVKGQELKKMAVFQRSKNLTVNLQRGDIFDKNGNKLGFSIPAETVVANPRDINESKEHIDIIAQRLGNILNVSSEVLARKLNSNSYFEVIKQKVDIETADKLRDFIKESNIKGIYLVDDIKRYYPNKSLAAHVIGFTNTDGHGLLGIEFTMDRYLMGTPGSKFVEVDAKGRALPFASKKNVEAQDGLDVTLTIDVWIQNTAEKALQEAIDKYDAAGGAVAIVMDPRNGDVLAMVSKPDFNLNEPYNNPPLPGINSDTWKGYTQEEVDLLNRTVWKNKAISNTYEPGSTFKSITSAAALEEGIIKPDNMIDDSPVRIDNWTIGSYDGYEYEGKVAFRYGVYKSSNPIFIRIAQNLGIDKFYKYVRAFGFYDSTGIGLPGEQSSIFQKKPTEIDMAVASFGQRFTITPMQLASAYAAIANGGKLMKPRLIKELTDSDGNVIKRFESEVIRDVVSKQTADTLRDILEGVVTEGTGKSAYVEGYRVAGKTGTSQTTERDVYVASFAAFAPADNPVISVLVAIFNPREESYSGGTVAGPVAAKIIEDTLSYLQVERRYTEKN